MYFFINKDELNKNKKIQIVKYNIFNEEKYFYLEKYFNEKKSISEKKYLYVNNVLRLNLNLYEKVEDIIKEEKNSYILKINPYKKNSEKNIFDISHLKNINSKNFKECKINHIEEEIEEDSIFIEDFFNKKERLKLEFIQKLLELNNDKFIATEEIFLMQEEIEENFKKIEIIDNWQKIYKRYPFHEDEIIEFEYKEFYNYRYNMLEDEFFVLQEKLLNFINSRVDLNNYSINIKKYFVNLFCIYIYYKNNKNFNINNIIFNVNILKEIDSYLKHFKNIEIEFKNYDNINYKKDKKNKINNLVNFKSFKHLLKYIQNENILMNNFSYSLNKNYKNSYNEFLNSNGYERINKLLIFIEGYLSYTANYFIDEEKIIKLTSFQNYSENNKVDYGVTFGAWTDIIKNTPHFKFIELTNLTINKINKIKKIFELFRKLRNEIKGHGCYYKIPPEKYEDVENLFLDNIEILKDFNIEIENINKNNIKHYLFYEDEEILLTFKRFNKKNKLNNIEFYNYSNPKYQSELEINISKYIYKLNVKSIKDYFIKDLKNYLNEKINFNIELINLEYNFDFKNSNNIYVSDYIIFEYDNYNIINKEENKFILNKLIERNIALYQNIENKKYILEFEFEENFSIFNEKNTNKIISKIEEIYCILEIFR